MSRDRRGMVLVQVVFVVLLMGMWASVGLSRAAEALRRVIRAEEVGRVEEGVAMGLESLLEPPDLATLCHAGPRHAFQRSATRPDGVTAVMRWRHLGAGMMLAEVDVMGRQGARARAIAWVVADSIDRSSALLTCRGTRLQLVGSEAFVTRPGE
jgi:hypothetical protein